MIKNTLYTGIEAVMAQITSLYKSVDVHKSDVLDWCTRAELFEMVTIRDWFMFRNVPLVIDQKKALLPCNCHKLLDVFDSSGTRIKFRKDGSYLFFDDNYTGIVINYRGLPVDDEGRPLFIQTHILALARYCIMNYFEEDFVTGKMDGQRWGYITNEWENQRDIARASLRNLSRNEIEEILQINADMVPKLGYIPLYNLD
jgi:hypothetical protein